MYRTLFQLTAVLYLSISFSASAISFDFYKLGRGAALDFLPTNGTDSTNGDKSSSDVDNGSFTGDLTFVSGGITATATGTHDGIGVAVVQDHENNWTLERSAGLGVYHSDPVDPSDDNITVGEILTITFDQVVTLTSIGLRAEGHNFTGWATGATFLFDGVSTLLPKGTGSIPVNRTGTTFTFGYGGTQPDQFYLASMAVPDDGATVILLGASMLAAVGLARRVRAQGAVA